MRTPKRPDSNPQRDFSPDKESNLNKLSLESLIPIDELQEMQDSFSEVAKVTVKTIDVAGNYITRASNLASLCAGVFKNTLLGEEFCMRCRPTFLGGNAIVDDDLSYECLPGLKNYLVPLKVSLSKVRSTIVGYIVIGPVFFMKRSDKSDYQQIADKIGISIDEFWSYILELRIFSYKGIHSFLEMVENLTNRILTLAYSRHIIQKKIFEDSFSQSTGQVEPLSNQTEEFLEAFLDFIADITHSKISSVMLLDDTGKRLTIRACRGLSESIVNQTSVKLGDGISGLAAETKRPFIINDDVFDSDLADRLKRKELFSSLVVPIRFREEVLGVVNISSSRTSPVKFDQSTVSILTKAAGLAGITLESIQ